MIYELSNTETLKYNVPAISVSLSKRDILIEERSLNSISSFTVLIKVVVGPQIPSIYEKLTTDNRAVTCTGMNEGGVIDNVKTSRFADDWYT
jgi:hypothetical protein